MSSIEKSKRESGYHVGKYYLLPTHINNGNAYFEKSMEVEINRTMNSDHGD